MQPVEFHSSEVVYAVAGEAVMTDTYLLPARTVRMSGTIIELFELVTDFSDHVQ